MRRLGMVVLLVFGLLITATVPLFAADREEEDDDYEWKQWSTPRGEFGFNGFFEVFYHFQTYNADPVDRLASQMGIDDTRGFTHGWGLMALGHVGKGWRIGGMGFGGSTDVDGIVTSNIPDVPDVSREIELETGGGGFTFEYSPTMIGPVFIGIGATVGGGSLALTMRQSTGNFSWANLRDPYTGDQGETENAYNTTTRIEQGFFLFEPYLSFRIHMLDWLALDLTGGYHLDTVSSENWQFNETEIIDDGPGWHIRSPFFRAGLAFGG
ncbi:hypothetical protein GF324_13155 [bacterium]|nr:hypothetical protein [bacterium]